MNEQKRIGIIGAMDCEVDPLIAQMEHAQTLTVGSIRFTQGTLCGKNTVIARCGIGKVFAAMCAQTMILHFGVSAIVNVGVAGSLCDGLRIGDIAVATKTVQHDMDTTALGDPPGLISGINVVKIKCDEKLAGLISKVAEKGGYKHYEGTIASGDCFIANDLKKKYIVDTFGAIACEMEGAAIGQVCYVNGIPFAVIRAISDDADGNAHENYPQFVKESAEKSVNVLLKVINSLG